MRHNLSRHKYFIKTCEKNAQGHYWSIDEAYLSLFKSGNFDEKAIKKAKLNSRNYGKYKTSNKFLSSRMKKNKKQQKENKHNSGGVYDAPLASSTYVQAADTQMYSPTMSCKSYASTQHNDSAYLSSSDFTNSSFNNEMANQHQQQQQTDMRLFNHLQPNLSLFESLSEI